MKFQLSEHIGHRRSFRKAPLTSWRRGYIWNGLRIMVVGRGQRDLLLFGDALWVHRAPWNLRAAYESGPSVPPETRASFTSAE